MKTLAQEILEKNAMTEVHLDGMVIMYFKKWLLAECLSRNLDG